jgi:sigma54-dependent transcription regulator
MATPANYPSPAMPEREGLVCTADHGMLFLDQVGDCAEARRAPISLYVTTG